MKRYPAISLKEPRRKPVGFHVNDGTFMLSIVLVFGTLAAMTVAGESYHIGEGKYDHLRPKAEASKPALPTKPTKVLPEKFKGGADRYDAIFAAYAANPEAFAVSRKELLHGK